MTDDVKFEDADGYSYNYLKDKVTFRDIILQHLKRITTLASVEFRGGFWNQQPVKIGGAYTTVDTYVPDSREVYSNAVECLGDMLCPYYDEEMLQAEGELADELEAAFKDETVVIEPETETEDDNQNKKQRRRFDKISDRVSYRGRRRIISQKLFRELCRFLYRKKYLELGTIED